MTTVVWDGRSMAGERMYCIGGTPVKGPAPKIRRLTWKGVPAVMGASGVLEYGNALMDWLESGTPAGREPMLPSDDDDGANVLLATADMTYLFHNSLTPVAIGKIPWAAGSGANYALGAMAMGASARKAVEIACGLDVNSGMGIDVLRLRGV